MKVLHVGIFRDHCLGGDIVFEKGFRENGAEVHVFDYRVIAAALGRREMNEQLAAQAATADLVFIGKGELLYRSTLAQIRKQGTAVALYYGDMRPSPEPWLVNNLQECDAFFMTAGGDVLRRYFRSGRPGRAAFFLYPCDPSLPERFTRVPRSVDPPLFTGTVHNFTETERREVYRYLCQRRDVQIVGSPTRYIPNRLLRRLYAKINPPEYLRGDAYIERILRARFGIGVSSFQRVRYYTSDRLAHYLTFGKLYLAYRFPGCEDLFRDRHHVIYYDNVDALGRYIEYFLNHQAEAELIGAQGQRVMLTQYNTARMVRMMLDVIDTGMSTAYPWVEVYS